MVQPSLCSVMLFILALIACAGGLSASAHCLSSSASCDSYETGSQPVQTVASEAVANALFEGGFVGGTCISTVAGWAKIEELRVGDLVWSASDLFFDDHDSQDTGLLAQPVTNIFQEERDSSSYSTLELQFQSVEIDTVIVANDHRMYEAGCSCWVPVSTLNASHQLLTETRATVDVLSVHSMNNEPASLTESINLFNIEVAHNHNYFVSTCCTSECTVLVHNLPFNQQPAHTTNPHCGLVNFYDSFPPGMNPAPNNQVVGLLVKGHSPPFSCYPVGGYTNSFGTFFAHHPDNYLALAHDQDVERQLQSSGGDQYFRQANRAYNTWKQQHSLVYQAQLRAILAPQANNLITSAQFCQALGIELQDWRTALGNARAGAPSAAEVADYNGYLQHFHDAHEAIGNIDNQCRQALEAQTNALF